MIFWGEASREMREVLVQSQEVNMCAHAKNWKNLWSLDWVGMSNIELQLRACVIYKFGNWDFKFVCLSFLSSEGHGYRSWLWIFKLVLPFNPVFWVVITILPSCIFSGYKQSCLNKGHTDIHTSSNLLCIFGGCVIINSQNHNSVGGKWMDVKSQACFVFVDMLAMSFIQHLLLALWTVPVGFLPCSFFLFNNLSV